MIADKKRKAIEAAARIVGVSPLSLARMVESTDPIVRRAARAVTTAPRAAKLRAFIRDTNPGD